MSYLQHKLLVNYFGAARRAWFVLLQPRSRVMATRRSETCGCNQQQQEQNNSSSGSGSSGNNLLGFEIRH